MVNQLLVSSKLIKCCVYTRNRSGVELEEPFSREHAVAAPAFFFFFLRRGEGWQSLKESLVLTTSGGMARPSKSCRF